MENQQNNGATWNEYLSGLTKEIRAQKLGEYIARLDAGQIPEAAQMDVIRGEPMPAARVPAQEAPAAPEPEPVQEERCSESCEEDDTLTDDKDMFPATKIVLIFVLVVSMFLLGRCAGDQNPRASAFHGVLDARKELQRAQKAYDEKLVSYRILAKEEWEAAMTGAYAAQR